MGREFCVGDKIKVVGIDDSSFDANDIGRMGKIIKVESQDSFKIIFDTGTNEGAWASCNDVELVEAYDGNTPTKAEPLKTAPEIKAIIPDQETMERLEATNNPVYVVDSDDYLAEHKIEQEEKSQDEFTAPDHKGYFVFVSSGSKPKHIHKTYEEALCEAYRLANQKENIGAKVYILAVLGAIQGTIEVNEVEV